MPIADTSHRPLGAFLIVFGLGVTAIAWDYPVGTVTAMGPGFVPLVMAAFLVAMGCVILVSGGRDIEQEITEAPAPVPIHSRAFLRPALAIAAAIFLFGLAVRPAGLLATAFASVLIAGLGHPAARLIPTLVLAGLLAVGCCVIFALILGLQIPILPRSA